MAESTAGESAAPTITQGQTTTVGEGTHAVQGATLEGEAVAERAPSIFDNWLLWAVAAMWIWYLFGNKKRKAAKAQEKKERERRETLQKGDEIVTIGRIHGQVTAFTDDTVTIKPDPKSDLNLVFDRQAIFRVLPRPGEEAENSGGDAK